jgi:hypothetical protein
MEGALMSLPANAKNALLVAVAVSAFLLTALPAGATQYPGAQQTTGFSQSTSSYCMGYRFQCTGATVVVEQLGCFVPNEQARNVRLWDDTGTMLCQVTVPGNVGTWNFANCTNVSLTQGAYYIVSQSPITAAGQWYYKTLTGWGDSNITATHGRWSSWTGSHIFPLSATTATIYGVADIGYRTMPPPPTPASITVPATDTDGTYTISWSSASTASFYELEEDTNPGFSTAQTIYNGPNLSHTITGQQNGTYYYRVRAGNLGGTSGWRTGGNPCVVTLLPAAPGSLIVPANSMTGNYSVSWIAVPTAATYELEESFNSGGWTQVYNSTGTNWAAVGVSDGNYHYRVRARNLAGPSVTWTYGSYATSPPAPPTPGDVVVVLRPPQAPASLTVPFSDQDGVYGLSWGASPTSGVTYRLQEDTDPNFSAPTITGFGRRTERARAVGRTVRTGARCSCRRRSRRARSRCRRTRRRGRTR